MRLTYTFSLVLKSVFVLFCHCILVRWPW